MSLESGLTFSLGKLMGLACWVGTARTLPTQDMRRGPGRKPPAFFTDNCLASGCFDSWSKCLVNPSLDPSQLRKAGSFLSAPWNHSEENFYSAQATATYPVRILSLSSHLQSFWHPGLVLWKTNFSIDWVGVWFGNDSRALHLSCILFWTLLHQLHLR